jgi:hypothetical protein
MVEGFHECGLEVDFFEHCIYGKQNRVRFPSGMTRKNGILAWMILRMEISFKM